MASRAGNINSAYEANVASGMDWNTAYREAIKSTNNGQNAAPSSATSNLGPFTSALQNQGTTVSSGLSNLLITQPANQDAVSKAGEIVNQGQNKSSTLNAQLKRLMDEKAAKTQVWENGIYMGENKELAKQYDAQIADVQQQLKAEQEKQAEAAKPKTSSARDEYIRQLNDLTAYEGYATTVEQADAINKQKNELRQKLHEEDQRLGNAAQFYDSGERAEAVVKGGLGQIGSAYTNLLGTIKGVGNRLIEASNEVDQRVAANPYSGWATDPLTTANIAAGTTDEQLKQGMSQMQAEEQRLYQSADTQLANANAQLAQAKEGLSGLGQFGVDAATTLIQLGVDAAGSATGLGMLPMFARAAGGSMQEARQAGADTKQQVLYGLTKAAIEVGTEKLFDGVAGLFGRGVADDVVESVVKRLANSDTGRTLIRAFAAASGEGTEEAISDLLDPFAKLIYNDQALREAWENRSDLAGDMLYDYLLGFSMGGLGSVTSVATGQDAAKNAELRAIESPAKNTTAQAAPSAAQTAQEAAGDIQTPAIPQNASTAPTAELNQTQQKIPGQELLDYGNSKQGQQTATAQRAGSDLLNYGKGGQNNTASTMETGRQPISMEDYANRNSPVWNNLDYDDTASQQKAMRAAHNRMTQEGKVVVVPEETIQKTSESFPDLRSMKKADRTPILKQKMSELKASLRQFLGTLKGSNFEFEVNGNVLEARLYDTGIKEVLEKVNQEKANMLSQSDQIFKNAEYLYSLPDYDGDPNVYRWNYFYTPVKIGDSTVGVRIAVRDMAKQRESQIYNWGIKKAPTLDGAGDGFSRKPSGVSSVGGIDASLDGARRLLNNGSIPGGVSSEAPKVLSSTTSIPNSPQNVNTETGSNIPGQELLDYGNSKQGQQGGTAQSAGSDLLNYGKGGQNNAASTMETGSTVINDNPAVHTAEENANMAKYSAAANEAFNAATAQQVRIDDIAGKISEALGVPYTPGKQKSVNSIISRLSRNEARGKGSDWHDLKDLARTHIEMKSWDDIPRVLSMLDEMGIPYTASAESTDLGYKGLHITWYENGVGHELQLSTPEAWAVKQKTEELYAKWREQVANPDFVPTSDYDADVAQSEAMWDQLNLPDFSSFATSSGVSRLASSSHSSPSNMGERSLPQWPSANSENGLPGSYFIMRPESVKVTPTEKTSNNTVSSGSSIPSTPQNVNTETGPNMRERGFSQNIRTDQNMEAELRRQFEDSPLMYQQLSNAETLAKAQEIYSKGLEEATAELNKRIGEAKAGQKMSPETIPLSRMIANELTRQGKVEEATRIESDIATELTYVGEYAQAARILRDTGSPAAKAKFIKGLAKRLSDDLSDKQRAKNVKRGLGDKEGNIKVDRALIAEYANAQTDEASNAAIDKINQSIAQQMPATFREKFNAMRYVNMLGNLKTQGRNVGGNVLMLAATMAKRRTQAAIEALASAASGGKVERTTSFGINKDLYKAGIEDANAIMDTLQGEAKYSDTSRVAIKDIQNRRQIFSNKLLEGYRKITNWAMEAGDRIFLRANYADAFQGYLSAHGIKNISEASPELINSARAFAIKEAQEATFRDSNKVADWVSSLGRGKNTPKAVQILSEGVMPFRKTPANVGIRAVEYSPLGVAETIYKAVQAKKGNDTATDVINSASKNIVGTSLAVAGYLLAASGDARGSEDDDELAYFQSMRGAQDYSIKVGDEYISLSQLAPTAVPFFMGVELYNAFEDGGANLDTLMKVPGAVTGPLLEMSMLSGINDTLSDLTTYGGDGSALPKLFANTTISYMTQFLTNSLAGQAEQASEEYRQTTYSQPGNKLGSFQYALGQAAAKTPGVDYNQQDYIDQWGRRQSNGPLYERLFNAFLNPVYTSTDRSTEVDAELERLYTENKDLEGFPNVLPQKASRSLEYTKGVVMTPEEYQQYSIDRGQMSLDLVSDFMQSSQYKDMDDQSRTEVISNLYSLAADRALKKVKTSNGVEYTGNYDDIAKLTDIPAYMASKTILSQGYDDRDNFKGVDNVVDSFYSLPEDVQAQLKGDGKGLKNLLYANKLGIGSEQYYNLYDTIKEMNEKTADSSDVATAVTIASAVQGADEDKLNALKAMILPAKGTGKTASTVRRFEAALSYGQQYGVNITYDDWAEFEAKVKEVDENGSVSKADLFAAWADSSLRNKIDKNTARKIYNTYKDDEAYVDMYDEDYAAEYPVIEKEPEIGTYDWLMNQLGANTSQQTATTNNPLMTYSQPSLLFKTFDDYTAYKPPQVYPLMEYAK